MSNLFLYLKPLLTQQTKQNTPSEKGPNLFVDYNTIKTTDVNNLLSKTGVCSSEKEKLIR